MALVSALFEILQRPTIWDVWMDLMLFVAPLWIALLAGVLVGWAWKPSWANFRSHLVDLFASSAGPPSSHAWPTKSYSYHFLSSSVLDLIPSLNSLKSQLPNYFSKQGVSSESSSSFAEIDTEKSGQINRDDLQHLSRLVDAADGGPAWIPMMERSMENMSYQAWRRDPENGPPQYRSRTVYEDATPEVVRDFFWDDQFRLRSHWDDMLISSSTLEECRSTGTMLVHWVRKFPFFCSDREYLIGRRIWKVGDSYYCVTKGVPSTAVPRQSKPRRVDLYYSSWCIRAVESKSGDGQKTACEVLLFHHEDMGIPWELAKLGVRQGMWGAVKKIEPGLRAYRKERALGAPLSPCTIMAQINTKVSEEYLRLMMESRAGDPLEVDDTMESPERPLGRNIPKVLVVGGAIVLACSLDKGLLTKAVIFGVARRFAKIGRKL